MKPRPKPLLGLLLGLLLGIVIVGLLWQLGVAPPDRLILFGVLAVSIALTELLLTQTTRRGKRRFVTVMVIAGIFGGVALTGIPETVLNKGSLSDGCRLTATSAFGSASPTDTSAFDPLDTSPTDSIDWEATTDQLLTNWDSGLGMTVGGIPIPLWTATRPNAEQFTQWSSTETVADYLQRIEEQTGLQLRGTYHVYGYIDADEGTCDMAGYLRVQAEGPFATGLLIALWVAGALLVVMIVWIASSVGRSVKESKTFASRPDAVEPPHSASPERRQEREPQLTPTPTETAPKESADRERHDSSRADRPKHVTHEHHDQVTETRVMEVAETQQMPVAETEALPLGEGEDMPETETEVLPTTEGETASGSEEDPDGTPRDDNQA